MSAMPVPRQCGASLPQSVQIAGLRTEITDLRSDMPGQIADLRDDMRRLDDRLRAVEIAFGKVDQRLLTLERAS